MSALANHTLIKRLLWLFDISAFLRWWWAGLIDCLPARLRRGFPVTAKRLVVDVAAEEVVLREERGGESKEIMRFARRALASGAVERPEVANDMKVVLRLSEGQALSRLITLPQAAEANLLKVVGFEIDRLTPFPADKIYYDAQIVERHADARTVQVRFTMVLRETLDKLLRQLALMRLAPDVVTVSDVAGSNLLPLEKRPRKRRSAHHLRWALVLLILVSGLAAAALPLWQQRSLVVTLLPQAGQAEQQAQTVFALREQLEAAISSSRFLAKKRAERPLMIDILNELTAVLPDDTWVEQLNVRGKELQVRGQSQEASKLISLLEASELFSGVTFRSPVTNDRRTGRDRFYLIAEIGSGDG